MNSEINNSAGSLESKLKPCDVILRLGRPGLKHHLDGKGLGNVV